MVPKGLKQVLICIALFLTANVADARSRRNPTCNEDQQKKMTEEFQLCLSKFTKEHHEATGKATTAEQYQVRIQSNYDLRSMKKPNHTTSLQSFILIDFIESTKNDDTRCRISGI